MWMNKSNCQRLILKIWIVLYWTYHGIKKIRNAWDCTGNKISKGWGSVRHNAWMKYAYYFQYDEWINARVNEDRKYDSDLQEKMINAHICENKAREDRWNSSLKREQKAKKER